jgi:hypothetical protein
VNLRLRNYLTRMLTHLESASVNESVDVTERHDVVSFDMVLPDTPRTTFTLTLARVAAAERSSGS